MRCAVDRERGGRERATPWSTTGTEHFPPELEPVPGRTGVIFLFWLAPLRRAPWEEHGCGRKSSPTALWLVVSVKMRGVLPQAGLPGFVQPLVPSGGFVQPTHDRVPQRDGTEEAHIGLVALGPGHPQRQPLT